MSWLLKRWLFPEEQKSSPPIASAPSPPVITTTVTLHNNNNIPLPHQQRPELSDTPNTTEKRPSLIPNNAKLLIGGLLFFSFSAIVTRRALIRKYLSARPPFYTTSMFHKPEVSGGMDAFEALNIATLNTVSIAMIAAGATFCVLDIDSVETARNRYREKMYGDSSRPGGMKPTKEEEEQFEKDMEEWLESVFDKKDLGEVRRKVEEARVRQAIKDLKKEQADSNQS